MKQRVYDYLAAIPRGRVVTYGQIASHLGDPKLARAVGNILHQNPDPDRYPCYKVVNSRGGLSERYAYGGLAEQKRRLEADGIAVTAGRVDLAVYGMRGRVYGKLVRDRIPEIIASAGGRCQTAVLTEEEYLRMLDRKLDEELAEYRQDPSLEELADLWEVIRAVTVARGYSLSELEAVRAKKAATRGAFDSRILLVNAEDKAEEGSHEGL